MFGYKKLEDWALEQTEKILKYCLEAMPPNTAST